MKRFSVEIGQVFGRLTVAGGGAYNGQSVMVPCSCSCGGSKSVARHNLVRGHVASCGCIKKERMSRTHVVDVTGQVFGMLTVIEQVGRTKRQSVLWRCECKCGGVAVTTVSSLKSGRKTHCGCFKKPRNRKTDHPLHSTWRGMIQRCNDKNSVQYNDYGGRGISVCDEWVRSFDAFVQSVGPKPSSRHTLDRIDNNGNYEPANVRWSTPSMNARNKRNNRMLEFNGEVMCCSDWSDKIGLDKDVLLDRLNKLKWSVEKALTTPLMRNRSRKAP